MESVRNRIVTLASMRPAQNTVAEASTSRPLSPADELQVARYYQIMERLQQETDEVGTDVMITVQDREASLAQSKMAKDAAAIRRPLPAGGLEVKFGDGVKGGDWLGWIWSLTDWVDRSEAHKILRPASATADTFTGDLRVAMAADWGTGLYGAPKIADSVRTLAATRKFDLGLHLGDIYYSGTEDETKERFLDVWPTDASTTNRALNGNHEMYSGGYGYFDLILPSFKQSCSYFALQNENWLLVGLDTAYIDHDMDNAQVAWLTMIVSQSQAPKPRKVVLFSHQQPFSRLDNQGPKLQKALKPLLENHNITAWYWGHEHQCVLYDKHADWGLLGRCLGNGGIPSVRNDQVTAAPADAAHPGAGGCTWRRLAATADSPACLVLDGPNLTMEKAADQQKFAPHGFMTLDFKGSQLIEQVFLCDGTLLYSNTIG